MLTNTSITKLTVSFVLLIMIISVIGFSLISNFEGTYHISDCVIKVKNTKCFDDCSSVTDCSVLCRKYVGSDLCINYGNWLKSFTFGVVCHAVVILVLFVILGLLFLNELRHGI